MRYIITRPELPKEPRRTKDGLSVAKAQDTTAAMFSAAAALEIETLSGEALQAVAAARANEESSKLTKAADKAQEKHDRAAAAFEETEDHLDERDRGAWCVSLDIFSGEIRQEAAIEDAVALTAQMRSASAMPPRNPSSCDRCDWSALCEGDPKGIQVWAWYGVGKAKPAGDLRVLNPSGFGWRRLGRDRPGAVVSPSELRAFSTCQRKWHLEYVLRLRPTDRKWAAMGARIRGVMTHSFFEAMLAEWTKGADPGRIASWAWADPEEAAAALLMQWKDAPPVAAALERCKGDLDPNDFDGLAELLASLPGCVKGAHDAAKLATRDADEVIAVEGSHALKLPGRHRWVFGMTDAVIRQGDTLTLIELKTTSSKQLDAIAERYRNNPAVDLYSAMIEHGRAARKG